MKKSSKLRASRKAPVNALRALVVEDELANRELLARVLRLHGCDVNTAGGVAEAEALIGGSSAVYDLLVTDLRMDGEDGVALLQKVAALAPDSRPGTIVVLSGFLADYYDRLRQVHLDLELFQKPVHFPSLLKLLNRLRKSAA